MNLGDQQRLFTQLVGKLIDHIYELGYAATLDWCYRPPEIAQYYADHNVGIKSSLHTIRLAIDINLFKGGKYLSTSEDHQPIGEWWEQQHPLCRWGGRFKSDRGLPKPDGNHYSMEFGGIK